MGAVRLPVFTILPIADQDNLGADPKRHRCQNTRRVTVTAKTSNDRRPVRVDFTSFVVAPLGRDAVSKGQGSVTLRVVANWPAKTGPLKSGLSPSRSLGGM